MKQIVLDTTTNTDSGIPDIPADTELSLSVIESGCLFISFGGRCSLIIKARRDEVESLGASSTVKLAAELIERPEFPTLRMLVELGTVNEATKNYEYFFNMESRGELELLRGILNQHHLEILLYDSRVRYSIRAELGGEIKKELEALIGNKIP